MEIGAATGLPWWVIVTNSPLITPSARLARLAFASLRLMLSIEFSNSENSSASTVFVIQKTNMKMNQTSDYFERREYSVRGLANWILDLAAELGLPITNMALNKLVYFACERMLIERRILLTNAKIEAWEHGPVFREIYQSFKGFDDKPISTRAEFFLVATSKIETSRVRLMPEDEAILRRTLKPLMPLPASRLRAISHVEGGAWHLVWWHEGEANPGMEITPELIIEASNVEHAN